MEGSRVIREKVAMGASSPSTYLNQYTLIVLTPYREKPCARNMMHTIMKGLFLKDSFSCLKMLILTPVLEGGMTSFCTLAPKICMGMQNTAKQIASTK